MIGGVPQRDEEVHHRLGHFVGAGAVLEESTTHLLPFRQSSVLDHVVKVPCERLDVLVRLEEAPAVLRPRLGLGGL